MADTTPTDDVAGIPGLDAPAVSGTVVEVMHIMTTIVLMAARPDGGITFIIFEPDLGHLCRDVGDDEDAKTVLHEVCTNVLNMVIPNMAIFTANEDTGEVTQHTDVSMADLVKGRVSG